MIYMKTEAYQRVNLSYHEHLPSWVLTFVPTKHGSHLLKSNITVEKPQFHIRFIRCYNIYRCTCVTYPSGCGSKWKTDVGPQMWMSSLVLTIQLLGYLILTHSHLSIFPFIFFHLSNIIVIYQGRSYWYGMLRRQATLMSCAHWCDVQQPRRISFVPVESLMCLGENIMSF